MSAYEYASPCCPMSAKTVSVSVNQTKRHARTHAREVESCDPWTVAGERVVEWHGCRIPCHPILSLKTATSPSNAADITLPSNGTSRVLAERTRYAEPWPAMEP